MLCVMMLPLVVVVGCTSKRFCQSVRDHRLPAWIMQPPKLADTAEQDYFTPQREGQSLCKNNWEDPEVY